MTILLLGANGQIGSSLRSRLGALDKVIVGTRDDVDLSNHDLLLKKLKMYNPQIVVNAAAYTGVNKAEEEQEEVFSINVRAVQCIAEWANENQALLVHYSSDYVFDGTKPEPYVETDRANPVSVYGKSKIAADQVIASSGCLHLIYRTSWVYDNKGRNFAENILHLARQRDTLKIIGDTSGSPTHAGLIADVTIYCLRFYLNSSKGEREKLSGLYHLTAGGWTSWYGFAMYLIAGAIRGGATLACSQESIISVLSSEYNEGAARPLNSILSCEKIKQTFGVNLPVWEVYADKFLKDWIAGRVNAA